MNSSNLMTDLRKFDHLLGAWLHVRENGRKSQSKRTKNEIEVYGSNINHNLRSLQGQLQWPQSFKFDSARGWAAPNKDPQKDPRPVVITPVRSRVAQRAILEILLEQAGIQEFIQQPYSFGGITKADPDALGAVPGAISAIASCISAGKLYFIRSDICGFFRMIPKGLVFQKIRQVVEDEVFCELLEKSADLELINLNELRAYQHLFPKQDVGVAQGSALSPLMGNILLSDFDKNLNSGVCTCIRYIDDFVILGPTKADVEKSFSQAIGLLKQFDMVAYDPSEEPNKAESGHVDKEGLTFLGVEIRNRSIRPTRKNRGRLRTTIKEIIDDHLKINPNSDPNSDWDYMRSFAKCLQSINAVVAGWGNQYYFCNDRAIFANLDGQIDELLDAGLTTFLSKRKKFEALGKRRQMGVRSLQDCKIEPITWG